MRPLLLAKFNGKEVDLILHGTPKLRVWYVYIKPGRSTAYVVAVYLVLILLVLEPGVTQQLLSWYRHIV